MLDTLHLKNSFPPFKQICYHDLCKLCVQMYQNEKYIMYRGENGKLNRIINIKSEI